MIISVSNKKIKIGDYVITKKEIIGNFFIITTGHKFKVLDKNSYGFIIYDEEEDVLLTGISENYLTLKIDYKSAEKEYIFDNEVKEYKKYICKYCTNITEGYDDREIYTACKIMTGYYPLCRPTLNCVKYLNKNIVKSNIILLKHLRREKLLKLKNI